MNLRRTHALLLTGLFGLAPLSSADLIVWGTPQDTTSPTQVSTNGTPVGAYAFWDSATATPQVVNGVTFEAPFSPDVWLGGGGNLMGVSSTGDLEFDQVLRTARTALGSLAGNPTDWAAIRLDTLVTLTAGQSYEVQAFYCDQRFGALRDRVMTMSSALGPVSTGGGIALNLDSPSVTQGPLSGGLEADPNNFNQAGDTVFGQFVIGSFMRNSTEPLWLLVQGSNPVSAETLRPHLTALQIRAVDGVSIGAPYCTSVPNSTGVAAGISAFGSQTLAQNDVRLSTGNMPQNSFGFFITSQVQGFLMNPGGSQGNLCLGGAIGRYVGPGQIMSSGAAGMISLDIDLTQVPQPNGAVAVAVGETWNWSTWYRDLDTAGNATSNFSNGLEVTFF